MKQPKHQNFLDTLPLVPQNGLLNFVPPPKVTLDEEMGALISRHGAEAVRNSLKRLTRKKPGRKQEGDWAILIPYLKEDAVIWLDGGDPFTRRSNYWLAQKVCEAEKGQSAPSTHRRVMRKLSQDRRFMTLMFAFGGCTEERPYPDLFRTVHALQNTRDRPWARLNDIADMRRGFLERYRKELGEPDASKTFSQLEAELSAEYEKLPLLGRGLLGGSKW